ncbi:MAG: GMC family oxidoreductase [Candidatus Binatia bacterium]|nr:GMC family oxidoreductase [Candidatus Binatia bacterium]
MMAYDAAQLQRHHRVSADAVVVGSGAGGAVAAAELAAAGWRVVLLEEGSYFTGVRLTGDVRFAFSHLYRNGGLTGTLGVPPIIVPLGRCVGGTTTINSGTCYRTPDFVLQMWEHEYGLEGATELGEHYAAIERDLRIKPVPDELYGPANGRIQEAVERVLRWKGSRIPRNEHGCLATGRCAFGCPSDGKLAMSVSKVPEALASGATLWVHARVRRILFDRRRTLGVVADAVTPHGRSTGVQLDVFAPLVVVAAGALHTPALLQASGVQNAWLGRNLHLHPATRVVALFPEPIRGWREVPQAYNIDEFIDQGVFIQGQFVPPEVQAAAIPGFGHTYAERMRAFELMASFGALISDESSGRVWSIGSTPHPVAWYRLGTRDVRKLLFAIARTAEAFFAAGAVEVYSGVSALPVLRRASDVAALERARVRRSQLEVMAFHPMGTARAGRAQLSVCDPWGRVHGYHGLAVADASLFPTSNRINPQLTIMALVRRNARAWVARGG